MTDVDLVSVAMPAGVTAIKFMVAKACTSSASDGQCSSLAPAPSQSSHLEGLEGLVSSLGHVTGISLEDEEGRRQAGKDTAPRIQPRDGQGACAAGVIGPDELQWMSACLANAGKRQGHQGDLT